MLSLLLFSCLSTHPSLAAPITNNTSSNATASSKEIAPSWVSEPPGRGTWNLLYSCVFTLVLCVWTSVHLNVPGYGETAWQMYRRKAKWVAIALFAPEFVVYCAFQQWFTAKMFLKELQRLHEWVPPASGGKENARKPHKFDMTYAMFAVMGGFVVDIDHLHNKLKRATLTTNGILLLAQHGHFFYVEPDAIADKSKANLLAKGLVCVQVLWVAGQAIERKVAGLPISLLEYHTLVHVVCALVMYVLWFQKPYDIQYATLVATQDFPEALGFIVASSRWRGYSGFQSTDPKRRLDIGTMVYSKAEDPKFEWLGNMAVPRNENHNRDDDDDDDVHANSYNRDDIDDLDQRVSNYQQVLRQLRTIYRHAVVQRGFSPLPATSICVSLSSGEALFTGLGPDTSQDIQVSLSSKDLSRLNLAGRFIAKLIVTLETPHTLPKATYGEPQDFAVGKHYKVVSDPFSPTRFRPYGTDLISFRIENTAGYDDMVDRVGDGIAVLFMALSIILGAYGAIHLAAMHSTFPTITESTLWKASCYILLCSAGLFALLIAIIRYTEGSLVPDFLPDIILNIVLIGAGLSFVLFYVSARIFIVVESFISLRHMPSRVYQTPDLGITNYIPHI